MCVAASRSILPGMFWDHLSGDDRLLVSDWELDMLKGIEQGVYIRMHCCTFIGTKVEVM